MHLIYIHQYFKTPDQGGAIRSYYMAKGLVDKGHQVDMITAHNGPYKLIQYRGYKSVICQLLTIPIGAFIEGYWPL